MFDSAPSLSLDQLSESQRQAVLEVDSHALILAGAGSGKTRVITHRIAYLLAERGVQPHRILALTFTKKAAQEMRERIEVMLQERPPRNLWIMTFHALGARLLRLHAEAAGLEEGFSIFDDDDQKRLLKRVIQELGFDPKMLTVATVKAAIQGYRAELKGAAEVLDDPLALDPRIGQVYARYEQELQRQNAVDFGGLLTRPTELLKSNEELRRRYQRRFRYLMVDEYQDTNPAQYQLIRLLTGPESHLCAVGDEDQSIYGWRGADIRNILDFQNDFPETKVLQLAENYRCPEKVLEASNRMIQRNRSRLKEREVFSKKPSPFPITFYQAYSAQEEAEFLAESIRAQCYEMDREPGHFAVFYRTHAQARVLEQALLRKRLPYRIHGGLRFFERKVIKDLICYLRLLANPLDREALGRILNVPRRGIGPKSASNLFGEASAKNRSALELLDQGSVLRGKAKAAGQALAQLVYRLQEMAADGNPPSEILHELTSSVSYYLWVQESAKPEDKEFVDELENALIEYEERSEEPTIQGFLEEAALVSPTDTLELGDSGPIHLMTLHNAKGLEFPVVYITGLEDGLLPHSNSVGFPERLEEERRLFYVGMTRTQERLILTSARTRMIYGRTQNQLLSPFVQEIGPEHLKVHGYEDYDW